MQLKSILLALMVMLGLGGCLNNLNKKDEQQFVIRVYNLFDDQTVEVNLLKAQEDLLPENGGI